MRDRTGVSALGGGRSRRGVGAGVLFGPPPLADLIVVADLLWVVNPFLFVGLDIVVQRFDGPSGGPQEIFGGGLAGEAPGMFAEFFQGDGDLAQDGAKGVPDGAGV